MTRKLVTPGEPIGLIEEYISDEGTYEDGSGVVRGKYLGFLNIDKLKREATVSKIRKPILLEIGDEVIGRIFNVSGVFGYVKIEIKNGEPLDRTFTGVVYPHRIVKDVSKVYRVGDHIYARVISLKNRTIHLSITGKKYGVIKAFCRKCGATLVKAGREELKCPKCGNKEIRKLSLYYNRLLEGLV